MNKYAWQGHLTPGRVTSFNFGLAYQFHSGDGKTKTPNATPKTPVGLNGAPNVPDARDKSTSNSNIPEPKDFSYFKIPWTFGFNYAFNYTKTLSFNDSVFRNHITSTVGFNGTMSLTPKWKLTYRSGYDFKMKQFSVANFSIERNLHCWVMTVEFSPFGQRRYYNFRLNVLSSMLHDLKYEKKQDYNDYGYSNY